MIAATATQTPQPKAYQPNSFVAPSILYHLRLVGSATASRTPTLYSLTEQGLAEAGHVERDRVEVA